LRKLYRFHLVEHTPEARGRRLLREWLSPAQRKQFDSEGYFDVIGCNTGRRYRIHYGTASNVREISETGHHKMGLCFVPQGDLAPGDVMLAQKIALETAEYAALGVANRFPPIPPEHRRLPGLR
jgi:hypothetical protein